MDGRHDGGHDGDRDGGDLAAVLAVVRADRELIERAARRLRDTAITDAYAGRPARSVAFAFALLLDELARHVRDLGDPDAPVRAATRQACALLLDDRLDGGPSAVSG